MDNDKKTEFISDAIAQGMSSCCGANVYLPDICSDCGEHCEIENIEETED